MTKHIGILISPRGEEFYDAYGPMTKLRDKATRFDTASVAGGSANRRYGRHDQAFWNSERASRDAASKTYRGWTCRTEEVADDDEGRSGYSLYDYDSVRSEDRLYAHLDAAGRATWLDREEGCRLWPDRTEAVAFARDLPKTNGRHFAVEAY